MAAHSPSRRSWLVFIGVLFLLLAFAIATRFLVAIAPPKEDDAERTQERLKALSDLQTENAQKLNTYAWVDRSKDSVQIPIAEAMKLTMAELNARKPAPAGPIAPPAPTVSPSTAPVPSASPLAVPKSP